MRLGVRLYLGVLPAILAVFLVGGLLYWGQYGRQIPRALLLLAAVGSVVSLLLAWRNTRYVAERVARLGAPRSASGPASLIDSLGAPVGREELDAIEEVVDNLTAAVAHATDESRKTESEMGARLKEYAALLAETSAAVGKQLDEVRMPLHILLSSPFGELNENQEEMIQGARAAADAADVELRRLREIADLDRGALSLRRDSIRIGDLVRSLVPSLEARAEREGIRFRADVAPALPRIRGDRARLHDALGLLLTERIVHAPADSDVTLALEAVGGGVDLTIVHGGRVRLTAEDALARRLLAAHGATVEESPGHTLVTIPAG